MRFSNIACASGGYVARRVARLPDVHAQSLLLELRDLAAARGERPVGPVARLLAYDESNDSDLAETLKVWLDTFGDVRRRRTLHPPQHAALPVAAARGGQWTRPRRS